MEEVDFIVLNEDYSRYLVHDGTILKAKVVVRKILFTPQRTPEGYPAGINVDGVNIVTSIVPPGNKRQPSPDAWNQRDKGEERKFEEQEVKIQEYMTTNGYRITVKPVLSKVFRYEKFNNFGEPIYSVALQTIINIDKIATTAGS